MRLLQAVGKPQANGMTELNDGVTDARIQAKKVIAENYFQISPAL